MYDEPDHPWKRRSFKERKHVMYDEPDVYSTDALAIKETDQALLVETEHGTDWVPKSQIVEESEVQEPGDEGVLVVTGFIAREKGWL